jgi:hypothetical protein
VKKVVTQSFRSFVTIIIIYHQQNCGRRTVARGPGGPAGATDSASLPTVTLGGPGLTENMLSN